MADLFTPETATWGTPAMPSSRRGMNFTKEDLLAALVASQNQPKSPYQLQFEAPILPPQQQDREQQFQQDWDAAMQAYQQGMGHLKTNLPPGITYEGKSAIEHTPEEIFNQTIAPLRFQAAEFSPGITSAFGQKALTDYRTAELAHQKQLEKNAAAKLLIEQMKAEKNKPEKIPPKFTDIPNADDKGWLLKHIEDPAAWDRFESKYGPGSAKVEVPKAKDPRPLWSNLDVQQPFDLSAPFPGTPPVFGDMPKPTFSLAGPPQPEGPTGAFGRPTVGEIRAGFRFKGGDPSVRSNWEAVK